MSRKITIEIIAFLNMRRYFSLVATAVLLSAVVAVPPSVWDADPAPASGAVVTEGDVRFTVLSPALIRIQRRSGAAFDDRASAVVINRQLPVPAYTVTRPSPSVLVLTTASLTLTYDAAVPVPSPAAASCGYPRLGLSALGGIPTEEAPYGINGTTQAACCAACSADTACVGWTFVASNATCQPWVQVPTLTATPGATFGRPYAPLSPAALSVIFALNASARGTWAPAAVDAANLPGTYQKLECYVSPDGCAEYFETARGASLLSRSGWFLHDDTRVLRMAPAPLPSSPSTRIPWYDSRASEDALDWYLLARGRDYPAALADWVAISGAASMPQASAFGVAWSRWFTYNASSFVADVLQGYHDNDLPL